MSEEKRDPFEGLSEKDQRFVEGLCAGMSAVEAAKYAGSEAATKAGLASHASRWQNRPEIRAAVAELRKQQAVDDDGLWDLARKALRELLTDKGNPNARARACEILARVLGKLQPERHEHVHAHMGDVEPPDLETPEGEEEFVRLLWVVLKALPREKRARIITKALRDEDAA